MLTLVLFASVAVALDNGLGLTPQMGWNSWNHFGCSINETLIKQTADAFISTGLHTHGYVYVNLDDCWEAPQRDSNGNLYGNPTTFPNGMKSLGDYIHGKGLKYGIYSDAGYNTCAGRPASLGHETADANTYASWGVDYLKYDNCNTDGTPPEKRYPVMRDALNATGRPIFFSMCEWGVDNPATWAPNVGNSWRTTGDIGDNWNSMIKIFDANAPLYPYAKPGAWNDPDMLEIGNGGMSNDEEISHFSLWCAMKAPLLVGCDITKMSTQTTNILFNDEVIAINQDKLGQQARIVSTSGNSQVIAGNLTNAAYVVVLLNRNTAAANITATWTSLGVASTKSFAVRDLWQHKDMGNHTDHYTAAVNAHGVVMVKLTPA
jgi:alpha-galactosidase